MTKIIAFVLFIILATTTYAQNSGFDEAIKLGKDIGKTKQKESVNQAQHLDPQSVFDYYTKAPSQSKYFDNNYQGNKNKDTLRTDGSKEKNTETGKMIASGSKNRPHYVISPNDKDIKHAKMLEDEAYNIVHGITDQYIDCKPKKMCSTKYTDEQCLEVPQDIYQTCHKKLEIVPIPHETVTHYPLFAHLKVKEHNYAGISVNSVNGRVDFLGPHDATFELSGRLPSNIDCTTLQGSVVSKTGNALLDEYVFPSCASGLNLTFHISKGHYIDLKIDMVSKITTYDYQEKWTDDCSSIANEPTCKFHTKTCITNDKTRVFNGIPFTRDCWEEKLNYICQNVNRGGTCEPLRQMGCEQIGSVCTDTLNEQCTLFSQTYRCQKESCDPTTDVICGNGKEYCINGECADTSYQKSEDFAKAASALGAFAEAGKEVDKNNLLIFTGHPVKCSEKPVGFSNCCAEKGWGQDVGLTSCSGAEKQLHFDRKAKKAIKVGRYCSGPEPFPCVVHSQVFCVFNSKIAKILQEQGRNGQLHIDFGNAKEPNCQGMTAEQLQALNLSVINFKDIIDDEIGKKINQPDMGQIEEKIKKHVDEMQANEVSHG